MKCPDALPLISAYADGELTDAQRQQVEQHLAVCPSCRRELEDIVDLKEKLRMMDFEEPSDAALEHYWSGVYNRLERGVGWVLMSIGAILLLSYAAIVGLSELLGNQDVPLVVKIGVVAAVVGLVVLLVSLVRERLTVHKTDRYSREIKR